jgi:hypothetical protein
MDRSVDTSTAQQRLVRGVDDRVDLEGRDIGLEYGDPLVDGVARAGHTTMIAHRTTRSGDVCDRVPVSVPAE